MADQVNTNSTHFDAMDPWRNMRDLYLETWARAAVEMVNTDAYAEASGAMLNNYLTFSAPFGEALEKCMLKALEQFAMPSRAEVLSIAERMTNIEIRLDDLDAKLDEISQLGNSASRKSPAHRDATIPAKRIPRNRK